MADGSVPGEAVVAGGGVVTKYNVLILMLSHRTYTGGGVNHLDSSSITNVGSYNFP